MPVGQLVRRLLVLPLLGIFAGAALTQDGWQQVIGGGFGDPCNEGSAPQCVYGGRLYASTDYNSCTGMAEVWSYDGSTWTKETWPWLAMNFSVESMLVFNSRLYMGTKNLASGCEVWEWDGSSSWTQVNSDGFGSGSMEQEGQCLCVHNNVLYAGTINKQVGFGCGVFRYDGGVLWTQVNTPGFGTDDNESITGLTAYGGSLFAATKNEATGGEIRRYNGSAWPVVSGGYHKMDNTEVASLVVYGDKMAAGTVNGTSGGELWLSDSLGNWSQLGGGGLGDPDNLGVVPTITYDGDLLIGTFHPLGGQIWAFDGAALEKIADGGFGDPNNTITAPASSYGGLAYATAGNLITGGEVWRYPMAETESRNAGTNPASFTLSGPPVVGSTITASIDLAGTTGHGMAILLGYTTPLSLTLTGGQTILVNFADPNGELLGMPHDFAPVAIIDLSVPPDIALVAFTLSAQALQVGTVQPFALSNAQDLFVGY